MLVSTYGSSMLSWAQTLSCLGGLSTSSLCLNVLIVVRNYWDSVVALYLPTGSRTEIRTQYLPAWVWYRDLNPVFTSLGPIRRFEASIYQSGSGTEIRTQYLPVCVRYRDSNPVFTSLSPVQRFEPSIYQSGSGTEI